MHSFDTTGPAWLIATTLGSTIIAALLVLDANWMIAIMRGGKGTPPPPLFKSRVPLPSGPRRLLWIAGFVFGLAPFMIQGVMDVGGHIAPGVRLAQMIALGVLSALLIAAEHRKWTRVSIGAALGVILVLMSPYALAGPSGWRAYAVVTGLLAAILGLMFLVFTLHRLLLGWRPAAVWVAGLRLAFDCTVSIGLLVAVYGPRFAPP